MFYENHIRLEVEADGMGDEGKEYIVNKSEDNDKQRFPMKQGVLTSGHVSLLPLLF